MTMNLGDNPAANSDAIEEKITDTGPRIKLQRCLSTGELTIVNNSNAAAHEKTVIVFGCGRGGTSALSGCLRILGVATSEEFVHPLKHEWSPVEYAHDGVDRGATKRNIDYMNAKYPVWGWKSPKDLFSFNQYASFLRNPHILIVFRNILDICNSTEHKEGVPPIITLLDASSVYSALAEIAASIEFPLAMVTYESLVEKSEAVTKNLSDWLGLNADSQALLDAAGFVSSDAGYRPLKGADHDGLFDEFELEKDRRRQQIQSYSSFVGRLERTRAIVEEDLRNARECRNRVIGELAVAAQRWAGEDDELFKYIIGLDFMRDQDMRAAFRHRRSSPTPDPTEAQALDEMRKQSRELQSHYEALRGLIFTMLGERLRLQHKMDQAQASLDLLSSLAEKESQSGVDELRRLISLREEEPDGGEE
jgi:hypothetical protein